MSKLPENDAQRKAIRIYDGFMKYFPDAIIEVTKCSCRGNEQHHKDDPLWWDKTKSKEELNSMMRHLIEAQETNSIDDWARVAWRAMANLQRRCDAIRKRDEISQSNLA